MTEHIYEDSDMEHERYHVIPFGSMREQIVRCKDCKHVDDYYTTPLYCYRQTPGRPVEPDGFCAWGERMDG